MTKQEQEWLISFGDRVKSARISRNLSQAQLASKLNIATNHLSEIERGKSKCGILVFLRIVEALQISADDLLRANVPSTTAFYAAELDTLLSNCSSAESNAILRVAREMKAALHSLAPDESDS